MDIKGLIFLLDEATQNAVHRARTPQSKNVTEQECYMARMLHGKNVTGQECYRARTLKEGGEARGRGRKWIRVFLF